MSYNAEEYFTYMIQETLTFRDGTIKVIRKVKCTFYINLYCLYSHLSNMLFVVHFLVTFIVVTYL